MRCLNTFWSHKFFLLKMWLDRLWFLLLCPWFSFSRLFLCLLGYWFLSYVLGNMLLFDSGFVQLPLGFFYYLLFDSFIFNYPFFFFWGRRLRFKVFEVRFEALMFRFPFLQHLFSISGNFFCIFFNCSIHFLQSSYLFTRFPLVPILCYFFFREAWWRGVIQCLKE